MPGVGSHMLRNRMIFMTRLTYDVCHVNRLYKQVHLSFIKVNIEIMFSCTEKRAGVKVQ